MPTLAQSLTNLATVVADQAWINDVTARLSESTGPIPGIWYVNTRAAQRGDGSAVLPFNTIQAAINAATNFDALLITTHGDYAENIVMRDLEGISLIGNSEISTTIVNSGASHTFTWVPGTTTGSAVTKFIVKDIEFINTDVTGTYHAIHIDANAVVYPNVFCSDEFDLSAVDIEYAGGAGTTAAYFRNTGNVYWNHGQLLNGDLTLLNTATFRARQVEIGTLAAPANMNVDYNAANPYNSLGRNDVTISQQSAVWGNVVITGHPIFQMDQSSIIVGNITATALTSFYSAGHDYCPIFTIYGQLGIIGGAGGNVTVTFPNPQTLGTAFNYIDFTNAHINGIVANGFVALDLRGAVFTQAALAVTGAASIDRSTVSMVVATPTATTAVSIVPPFPTGATYAVAACPPTAVATGVSAKTVAGFTLALGTGGGSTDVTITRI